jgi:hypothetical protein
MLNVLVVLMVNVGHEWIAHRFLTRYLLIERSFFVRLICFRIGKRKGTAWAIMSLIKSFRAIKGEILAGHTTSQCGIASRLDIVSSLVASCCLWSWKHEVI